MDESPQPWAVDTRTVDRYALEDSDAAVIRGKGVRFRKTGDPFRDLEVDAAVVVFGHIPVLVEGTQVQRERLAHPCDGRAQEPKQVDLGTMDHRELERIALDAQELAAALGVDGKQELTVRSRPEDLRAHPALSAFTDGNRAGIAFPEHAGIDDHIDQVDPIVARDQPQVGIAVGYECGVVPG